MKKAVPILLAILMVGGCAWIGLSGGSRTRKGLDPRGTGDFRFVVMGDSRPLKAAPDPVPQNERFLEAIRRAGALGPDFVVNLGDLIRGKTADAALVAREWDAYERACKDFRMPYVSVVGNHDVWDAPSADVWRRRFGLDYFSWDHKGCHFIALNSEVPGHRDRIAGEQLEWLKENLDQAKSARRIFVFVHSPLWAYGPKGRQADNPWNREVHPLLAAARVDTVFGGHWHQYCLHPTRDGVRYVVTGGAGAELERYELAGGFHHFVEVAVKEKTAALDVVTPDGRLPADVVTTEKVEALGQAFSVESFEAGGGNVTAWVRVKNPTSAWLSASVAWDTNGTAWQGDPAATLLLPSEEKVLTVRARVADKMFPLPRARVELVDGGRRLFGWSFLTQAVNRLGPMMTLWNVAGPFDLGLADATDAERADPDRYLKGRLPGWEDPIPPETNVDFAAVYRGKGGKEVRWRAARADAAGFVDLDALYKSDGAVACAAAYIHSAKGGRYDFTAGSDDSLLVRINGKEVWRRHAQRAAAPDEDFFSADLKEGWNEVLVKVANRHQGWGFYLRVLDPDRTLKYALRPGAVGVGVGTRP